MPTKRFEKLDADRRDNILKSAIIEFGEQGLEKATLQDVANRAGVAKALLYYYFEDREDVLTTVFGVVQQRLATVLVGLPPYDDPESFWVFVESIYTQAIEGLSADSWLMPFMMRVMDAVSTGIVPIGFEPQKQLTGQILSQTLRDAIQLGALREDLPPDLLRRAAFSVMRAADRWVLSRIADGSASPTDAAIVCKLLRDAVGAPRSAP